MTNFEFFLQFFFLKEYREVMRREKKLRVFQVVDNMSGCAYWRMLWQGNLLNMKGVAHVYFSDMCTKHLMDYALIDVLHIQRYGFGGQYEFTKKLDRLKNRFNLRLVYDLDDALFLDAIPEYNHSREDVVAHQEELPKMKKTMELCDEITVSTHALRNYILERTEQKNVTVIPNYPPNFYLGNFYDEENLLRNYRRHRTRPRILYAGSPSHFETRQKNLEEIVDDFSGVKEAVLETLEKYQYVFVGAIPQILIPFVKAGIVEFHSWQSIADFPRYLTSLNVNMAIAPLNDNIFNHCKSDIKLLEGAALGLPVACQDICTYSNAPIRFKSGYDLVNKINETLRTEESYISASRAARKLVQSRWLENKENIGKFIDLYSHPYESPQRRYL